MKGDVRSHCPLKCEASIMFSIETQCAVVYDVNYPVVTHLEVTGVSGIRGGKWN